MVQVEKKKMGRPTDNPKRGRLEIRTSASEEEMLEYCCAETGKTRAEIVRVEIRKVYEEYAKEAADNEQSK